MKKFLLFLLTLSVFFIFISAPAYAAPAPAYEKVPLIPAETEAVQPKTIPVNTQAEGACGGNMTWNYNNGTLTITGSGAMYDYDFETNIFAPWWNYRGSITSIQFSGNILSIGDYAFLDCDAITSVSFPESIVIIGEGAFTCCAKLSTVNLPKNLVLIGPIAFATCEKITSITFPDHLESIYYDAFDYCTALKTVKFNNGLKEIYADAFLQCPALKSVTIPSTVTDIGETAFGYDESYHPYPDFYMYGFDNTAAQIYAANNDFDFFCIAKEADYLYVVFGDRAILVHYFGNDTKITIPSQIDRYTVTALGASLFQKNTAITAVTIPGTVKDIGEYCFSECTSLKTAVIPDSVTNIEAMAFSSCLSLQSLTIPKNMTEIKFGTFAICRSLTSLTIPSNIQTVGKLAFADCESLTSLTIAEGVKTVSEEAFSICPSLPKVTIPASVTTIGSQAFGYTGDNFDNIHKMSAFTVYGYDHSAAATYAANNGFTFVSLTPKLSFTDVPAGIWYEIYVNDLVGKGILTGYGNSDGSVSFQPDKTISRAEFATILARASGDNLAPYENKTSFNDVAASFWGAKYIEWAYQNGIVSGKGSGKYDPNANITREEMAVMIYRFAIGYKKETLPQNTAALTFTDQASISSWASTAVTAMQRAGIIGGTANSDGTARFEPASNATRAQAAKMISVYLGL